MRVRSGPTVEAGPIATALAACRGHIVQAASFSVFLNLLYLAPTIYMLQVYDRVVPTRGGLTLLMLTLILAAAVLTIAALDLVRSRLLVRASIRLDRILATAIVDALMRTTGRQGDGVVQKSAGLMREFDTLRQTMTGVGALALFDVPWAPIYVLVCFMLHWALGTMAIAGAIILLVLTWASERATQQPVLEAGQIANRVHTGLELSLTRSGAIQGLGMRDAMVHRHVRERYELSNLQAEATLAGVGYVSIIKAVRLLMQSLALGLGALLAIRQQISPGAIFAASLLISRALQPIELITGAWKGGIQSRAAYRSLVALFQQRGPVREPTRLPAATGRIDVENLTVRLGEDRLLLDQVSFSLAPGELLGVIGPSGAGKSTLVKAIVGALPITGGTIRIDHASIADWPEDQLADAVGYVPQEATLFRGTIKENIARFRTEFDGSAAVDAEVVRAAQLCGAHEFILRLPKGYDNELGYQGTGLSVGQAQRLALARALYGNPPVIVMDEPNASLDAEGEQRLIEIVEGLRAAGKAIIVVAHRTGILAAADKLMVIVDGRVQLFGARAAVLARIAPQRPLQPANETFPAAAAQ